MAKGRVESDVADEAARQCWGARELLLRMGFRNEQITLRCGVKVGEGEDKPIEERMLHAVVEVAEAREAAAFKKHGAGTFTIECGPVASRQHFTLAMQRRMRSIGAGVFSEDQLLTAWRATAAYQGRVDITDALRGRGFTVPPSAHVELLGRDVAMPSSAPN